MAVKAVLKKFYLHFVLVDLGTVEVMEVISPDQLELVRAELHNCGLELMDDRKGILIERIKSAVIELVHHSDECLKVNLSAFLSAKLNHDYTYLSNLFSEVQGITLEQFVISHKVERIKELIIYGDLNITEIAWKMNYCSVAHLSNQFKKITGLSPMHFKNQSERKRRPLEEIGTEDLRRKMPVADKNNQEKGTHES